VAQYQPPRNVTKLKHIQSKHKIKQSLSSTAIATHQVSDVNKDCLLIEGIPPTNACI